MLDLPWTKKGDIFQFAMWRIPEPGLPPVIIHFNGISHYKPSSYGGIPKTMEPRRSQCLLFVHLDSHPKQLLLLLWQQPSMQRTAALGVQPGTQRQTSFHMICAHLAPLFCKAEGPGQSLGFSRSLSQNSSEKKRHILRNYHQTTSENI